jgi:hypothetical protein
MPARTKEQVAAAEANERGNRQMMRESFVQAQRLYQRACSACELGIPVRFFFFPFNFFFQSFLAVFFFFFL